MGIKKNITAFLVIGILGTLFHFVYEWTNENYIIGLFLPVSESVWEHLKLIFYPTLIYSGFEYFTVKNKPDNYIPAVAVSIFCGMFATTALYYIYSEILGFNISFIDISIFFIAVIILLVKRNKILNSEKLNTKNAVITSLILLGITAFLFAVWSYNPPSLGIFTPPVN